MTTSTLRDLCKAEAAVAMSAKTLRWGRAGESIRAGPQFSCRQVEGLRDVPRRLSLSLHSHSCPSNHSVGDALRLVTNARAAVDEDIRAWETLSRTTDFAEGSQL